MKKIAFIINPISGGHKKEDIPKLIHSTLDEHMFSPSIVFTEYAGHAVSLARGFADDGYYAVVAIGGDGTVNEVARGVRGSNTALGIVPLGSGNGLAHYAGIPLNVRSSIALLNASNIIDIDYGVVNGNPFFSTFGIGFDAVVANDFASTNRGLWNYVRKVIKHFRTYNTKRYVIQFTNKEMAFDSFLISVANMGEWGNRACIAPKADYKDGLLDVVIVKNLSTYQAIKFAFLLFTNRIDKHRHVSLFKTDEVTIVRDDISEPIHLDGTPMEIPGDLQIRVVHNGLKLLVKKNIN
ncbi:MAG: YegS/Rv2252/BmrU family lipid kinase [Paludibacteraceae bacterium]|nr:YegS/Rv2252/BmrU family lipid kinase [Paludibacteraceae bacterium]